jgi:hypothetical protein
VLDKLSAYSYDRVKHLIYTWRAIEATILVSTPEYLDSKPSSFVWQLWRWVISTHVHNPNHVQKEWKALCHTFKQFASGGMMSVGEEAPKTVPGIVRGQIGWKWFELFPWLTLFVGDRIPHKLSLESMGALVQTRDFPHPLLTVAGEQAEIIDFAARLQQVDIPPVIGSYEDGQEVAKRVSKVIGSLDSSPLDYTSSHVSVGFSGEYRQGRSKGGKATAFAADYLADYVETQAEEDRDMRTWTGHRYWTKRGVAPIFTMCRSTRLRNEGFLFGEVQHDDGYSVEEKLSLIEDGLQRYIEPEALPINEPYYGLDPAFPLQLYQLAIEKTIERGYLGSIKPYKTDETLACFKEKLPETLIDARAEMILEPGGKVRFVTMEEWYVNVFVQPIAHFAANLLSHHPILWSAFRRSAKGWDFASHLQSMGEIPDETRQALKSEGFVLNTFDLEAASDNLSPNNCEAQLRGFLSRFTLGIDDRYIEMVLSILFRGRRIHVKWPTLDVDGRRVYEDKVFSTSYGCLMGNSCTKEILCLHSVVMHIRALRELYTTSVPRELIPYVKCLVAGDDIILFSPRALLRITVKKHKEAGEKIQWGKVVSSSIFIFFTEEVITCDIDKMFIGKEAIDLSYDERIHVDAMKMRLLTPYSVGSILNDPTRENPAIGKARAVSRMIEWHTHESVKIVATRLFHRNMGSLINGEDAFSFIPTMFGGLGMPHEIGSQVLADMLFEQADPLYLAIVKELLEGDDYPFWTHALLRTMSCGTTVRGLDTLELELQTMIHADYAMKLYGIKTWHQYAEEIGSRMGIKPEEVTAQAIFRSARKEGRVDADSIFGFLARGQVMRNALLATYAGKPELSVGSNKDRFSPPKVFENFKTMDHGPVSLETSAFYERLVDPMPDFRPVTSYIAQGRHHSPFAGVFVKRDAILDPLNGMEVDLFGRPPREEQYF